MSELSWWGIFLIAVFFLLGMSGFSFNDERLIPTIWKSKNKIKRLFLVVASILLTGIVFSLLGAVGFLIVSPFLELFGISWFIVPNF